MFHRVIAQIRRFFGLFQPPQRRQVAALCWRPGDAGPEVMLITTRRNKRWTPPKGWPMEGRSLAGAAAQEAWEEAGVKGDISEDAIGVYNYQRRLRGGEMTAPVRVEVFPLQVDRVEDKYPERGQRKRKWMTPGAAAEAVREPELKRLIANFPA